MWFGYAMHLRTLDRLRNHAVDTSWRTNTTGFEATMATSSVNGIWVPSSITYDVLPGATRTDYES